VYFSVLVSVSDFMDELRIRRPQHVLVSHGYKTADGFNLGKWVANKRERGRKEKLSPDQVAILEGTSGWVWDLLHAKWEEGFSQLET
jgi:hypothetical protein